MPTLGQGDPVDPLAATDSWSRLVVRLQIFFDDRELATGTGILTLLDRPYLITALHNFTGRNLQTGECLSTKGSLP